jgi:Flp pilus assembly protein TadD
MIAALLLAFASATASAAPPAPAAPSPVAAVSSPVAANSFIRDADHAIAVRRFEEARLLIGRAVAAGASGPPVERLLANLAFQTGNFEEAVTRYSHLFQTGQRDTHNCQAAALAALHLGRWLVAKPFAQCAVASPKSSWRAWNARGVIADFEKDWDAADNAYSKARALAPDEAEIINNQGWSHLLRGDWAGALPLIEQAAKLEPGSERIANNLELARAALATDLPERRPDESDSEWAERLNDAGVAAALGGDRKKAIAAFTQALDASSVWYARASNNLEAVSKN